MNSNSPEILISNNQMQPTNTPKRKGISIYDFGKDRMVYFKNPYGAKAKRAYKNIYRRWIRAMDGATTGSEAPPALLHKL